MRAKARHSAAHSFEDKAGRQVLRAINLVGGLWAGEDLNPLHENVTTGVTVVHHGIQQRVGGGVSMLGCPTASDGSRGTQARSTEAIQRRLEGENTPTKRRGLVYGAAWPANMRPMERAVELLISSGSRVVGSRFLFYFSDLPWCKFRPQNITRRGNTNTGATSSHWLVVSRFLIVRGRRESG